MGKKRKLLRQYERETVVGKVAKLEIEKVDDSVLEEIMPESNDIFFRNKPEEIQNFSKDKSFFLGLKELQDQFYKQVKDYAKDHKVLVNTIVHFELIK